MSFSKEMLEAQKKLNDAGHEALVPPDAEVHLNDPGLKEDVRRQEEHSRETDIMIECYKLIEESDAVLLLNYEKKGQEGYIGASALMELGMAYYLGKKMFMLFDVPESHYASMEMKVMKPVVLEGDVTRIA